MIESLSLQSVDFGHERFKGLKVFGLNVSFDVGVKSPGLKLGGEKSKVEISCNLFYSSRLLGK